MIIGIGKVGGFCFEEQIKLEKSKLIWWKAGLRLEIS